MEEVWNEGKHYINGLTKQVQDTQKWVDEFEGGQPIQSLQGRDLRDITKSISQINDPKLKSTNFMKFMENISNGTVKLEDGTVRPARPEELEAGLKHYII